MKRCPTCQKEYADSMRFCQTDGTPLGEAAMETAAPDPYKTIVGGAAKTEADLLEIPPPNDPMKTMIAPMSPPKPAEPLKQPDTPIFSVPPAADSQPPSFAPEPKSSEPGLNAPSFGDLSPKFSGDTVSDAAQSSEPPKFDSAYPKDAPPPTMVGGTPFSNEPNIVDSPFGKPSGGTPNPSPFDRFSNESSSSASDKPFGNQSSSPFGNQAGSQSPSPFDKTPPPPYKDPEPMFGNQQSPGFNQSPFGQPQSPFGQSNDPFGNAAAQPGEWTPPPAPVAGWQDQGLGANTPFQPPMAVGQNNTLAVASLVCGILSICICGLFTGIPALVTGYMARNNISTNPAEYGGGGMALAGMILGGISVIFSILYFIFLISGGFGR